MTDADSGSSTLDLKGRGQIIGWSSCFVPNLLNVIASEKSTLLDIPASLFIDLVNSNEIFKSYFFNRCSLQEANRLISLVGNFISYQESGWRDNYHNLFKSCRAFSLPQGSTFESPSTDSSAITWHLSTFGVPNLPVGTVLANGDQLPVVEGFNFPLRFVGIPELKPDSTINSIIIFVKTFII